MRFYGKAILLPNGDWEITGEPHVILRMKRLFAKMDKSTPGKCWLSNTPENCRDLEWFVSRYPFELSERAKTELTRGSAAFQEKVLLLEQILAGTYTARPFDLAIPARDYQKQAANLYLANGFLLLGDDVGVGKAQPMTSKVLTPSGWVTIGDLFIGDAVVDPDGGIGYVTGIYPQGEKDVYRLHTKDRAYADCSEDHLWGVYSANDRHRNGVMRVMPLKDFMYDLKQKAGPWLASKWFLPLIEPIDYGTPSSKLSLDPYVLGVILGDGALSRGSVTITKPGAEEIIERMRPKLPVGIDVRLRPDSKGNSLWSFSRTATHGLNPLIEILRDLGVYGKLSIEKSIPSQYLRATVSERIELLRGLMDTDGDCAGGSACMFNTSSPHLRDEVLELARGLGAIASVSYRPTPKYMYKGEARVGQPAYRINIRLPFNPFTFTRKAERWIKPYMARAIMRVEKLGRAQMACIRVSTKRNLYITDDHIVTHNTASAICSFCDPRTMPAVVVTLTHLTHQWKNEIEKFAPKLRTHIIKKSKPYELATDGVLPDVVILNYHKLHGWADTLAKFCKSAVFDECQELRRTESAKYTAAKTLVAPMKFRQGLSATPVYNYGGEMYNVVNVLSEDALGSHDEFFREWSGGTRHDAIQNPKAFGSFLREKGIMLRRTRADCRREIPPITQVPHVVDSDPAALEKLKTGGAAELARIILSQAEQNRGDAFRAGGRFDMMMRQATGIAKAPYVADFVRLLVESGEKVVLFGWHHEVYDIWKDKLADLKPALYTGQESVKQKEEAKAAFVDGKAPVLIMSLRAGAGLDGLQKVCRTVVFGELDWSPGVQEQCTGRVARDGQTDPVSAYFLISETGSDPVVADVLGFKKQQSEGINNPNADVIEKILTSGEHVKKLARHYLQNLKHEGVTILEEL